MFLNYEWRIRIYYSKMSITECYHGIWPKTCNEVPEHYFFIHK